LKTIFKPSVNLNTSLHIIQCVDSESLSVLIVAGHGLE